METALPESLRVFFWDVDLESIRLPEHTDYVLERLMARGTWDAMHWVRATFTTEELASFLERRGHRLPPRERAYWRLVAGLSPDGARGGGRPSWAGR